jgi:Gpi18-like mannosyltransferase
MVFTFTRDLTSAWMGYTLTLVMPTLLINAAAWGQADIYYGCLSLMCVFFILKKRPTLGMAAWGMAMALKAPAIFLGPFLLVMLLKRQIPWKSIWIPPTIYLACSLPVFLAGGPLASALGMYAAQAGDFHALCMNCASIWAFFPEFNYDFGVILGIGITLAAAVIYVSWMFFKLDVDNPRQVYAAAVLAAVLMPFLLPKMHERYFYIAELLSIALIFTDWRYFLATWLLQLSAGAGYWRYLEDNTTLLSSAFSAFVNLAVLALLIWLFAGPESSPGVTRQAVSTHRDD